jgi:uncharacterized damage-inducible protein DinB
VGDYGAQALVLYNHCRERGWRRLCMDADAFRMLYDYHFSENRKLWDGHIVALTPEQFTREPGYSVGSVRHQLVHLMNVEQAWFSGLRGMEDAEWVDAAAYDDRDKLRARWDGVEREIRDYLAALSDKMLFSIPIAEPEEDRGLTVWQVLLQVVNHGTDHRAQVLRQLHDLGVQTGAQDFIFYVYEQQNPPEKG